MDPTYELHGLAVRSPISLDAELTRHAPDWTVRRGTPVEVDGPREGELIGELDSGGMRYWATRPEPGRWVVRHGGTAETEFDLAAGEIVLRADSRRATDLSPLLLAGSGMAHALAAGGRGCLHASAVEVDGRAIAFIGPSGRGKSTLAALLCAAGARAVTDDLLHCEPRGEEVVCHRGGHRIRLRAHAGPAAEGLSDPQGTADGRLSALAPATALSRLPLASVVAPRPARDADRVRIERLRGRAAASELLRSQRLTGWIDPRLATLHLDLCRDVAARVPIVAAAIPWGPPFSSAIARELTESLLAAK